MCCFDEAETLHGPLKANSCEFEFHLWRGVLDTTSCDKVFQWLTVGHWFSPGTLISSTNKTDCHDITEILLKVALITMTLTLLKSFVFNADWKIQDGH
jgi:hypothetical protein